MSPTDTTASAGIASALRALVPTGARSGVLAIDERHVAGLHDVEAAAISAAVPARRREFATGRALLRRLTGSSSSIGVERDRAPSLPPGWVGSLTHTDELALAVVAAPTEFAALGVDLEHVGTMTDSERSIVLREDDPPIDTRAALVLKEAAYKAWNGLGGPMIDFQDVRLVLDGARFEAEMPELPPTAGPIVLDGRWAEIDGHWLAVVAVPATT